MFPSSTLTAAGILEVFEEEITARAGSVTDTFLDGQRLFARSVLPFIEEVRRDDRMQGGVALKASDEGVCLYPYFFRQVCRNGAIMAETIASRFLGNVYDQQPAAAFDCIREGIAACCATDVFVDSLRKMRTACEMQVDLALNLLPLLSQLSTSMSTGLMSQIVNQFFREGDHSQFGLANAVTAVARETQDADLRWNLEEFGGGIAIGSVPRRPTDGGHAVVTRSRRALAVG